MFVDDAMRAIEAVNISYRINRRVTGALHQETLYNKPQRRRDEDGKDVECRHVRKPLAMMSPAMIDDIVDNTIRNLVKSKVAQLGGFEKGMFSEEKNRPYMRTREGRLVPIHKGANSCERCARPVGKAPSVRYVKTDTNHHIEIVALLDDAVKDKRWTGESLTFERPLIVRNLIWVLSNENTDRGRHFGSPLRGTSMWKWSTSPGTQNLSSCRYLGRRY